MKNRADLSTTVRLLPVPAGVVGSAVGGGLKMLSHESHPSVLVGAALLGAFTTAVAYFVPMLEESSNEHIPPTS